jgi:flagellar hook protein FlgE
MDTISAFQSGVSGIQTGMQSLNQNAAKIANADTLQSAGDLTEPLLNMIKDEQQIQASSKVIEASNEMLGSILDITV